MSTVFEGFVNGNLDVADIVEGVKYSDDVNSVFNALFNKEADNIVGVMLVAQKILTSEKHLKLGVGAGCSDFSQPLPRVFVEVAQA